MAKGKGSKEKPIYFNFPIQMLEGFITGDLNSLFGHIIKYAVYDKYLKLNEKSGFGPCPFPEAVDYFGIVINEKTENYKQRAKLIYYQFHNSK